MPTVQSDTGKKHFPYTASGEAAAKKAKLMEEFKKRGKKGKKPTAKPPLK